MKYTLTEYVEEQMAKFQISNTPKNVDKIRRKFTRVLQDIGIWDKAKSVLIGKSITKVFTEEQLIELYINVEPYLLKQANVPIKELNEYRDKYDEYIDRINNQTEDTTHKRNAYSPPTVTETEQLLVMIQTLFNQNYDLDITQWNRDKALIFFTDDSEADKAEYFLAVKRLNNPLKYYVSNKND